MRRRLVVVFLAIFAVFGCERGKPQGESAPAASASVRVPALDQRFEPLVADFDAAAGKVRVLALLSPT
jgi:hypothetical protein